MATSIILHYGPSILSSGTEIMTRKAKMPVSATPGMFPGLSAGQSKKDSGSLRPSGTI